MTYTPTTKKRYGSADGETYYGEFTEDRLGMITGSIQVWYEEPQGITDWSRLSIFNAPLIGVPCVTAGRTYDRSGSWAIYTYTYQGVRAFDIGFLDTRTTFELEVTMNQAPIQSHPNWAEIKRVYNWSGSDQDGFFRPTLPAGSKDTGIKNKAGEIGNPLCGVESYLVVGATLTKSYINTEAPQSALKGIGCIATTPPNMGGFTMPVNGKRNWMKMTPKIERHGNIVRVSESWQLSGPGGWVDEIYGPDAGDVKKARDAKHLYGPYTSSSDPAP